MAPDGFLASSPARLRSHPQGLRTDLPARLGLLVLLFASKQPLTTGVRPLTTGVRPHYVTLLSEPEFPRE